MPKLFLLLAYLLLPAFLLADEPPKLFVPDAMFNFGTVAEGDSVKHSFEIHNRGGTDLKIERVVAACGCTASTAEKDIVSPGEKVALHVDFNTTGFSGEKHKTVRLYTNDPTETVSVLSLKGVIEPEILLTPRRVFFGEISSRSKPEARQAELSVKVRESSKGRIGAVSLISERLEFEELSRSEKELKLRLKIREGVEPGEIKERLIVRLGGSAQRRSLNVPVFASVLGPFRVKPATIGFGVLEGEEIYERSIKIESLADEPLSLSEPVLRHPALSASLKEVVAGKQFIVRVGLDPKKVKRDLRASIKLKTNSKEQPELNISVYGILPPKL